MRVGAAAALLLLLLSAFAMAGARRGGGRFRGFRRRLRGRCAEPPAQRFALRK